MRDWRAAERDGRVRDDGEEFLSDGNNLASFGWDELAEAAVCEKKGNVVWTVFMANRVEGERAKAGRPGRPGHRRR